MFIQTLPSPDPEETTLPNSATERTTPAIFEDVEGERFLLLSRPEQRMTVSTWIEAVDMGIGYLAITADQFVVGLTVGEAIKHRETHHQGTGPLHFDNAPWVPMEALDYRSLMEATMAPQEGAQAQNPGTFVHLHNHSEYSLLDGLSQIKEMVDVAKAEGQDALAVTDHFHVAAHPELSERCKDAGIKPIFGIEANLVEDRHRRGRSWVVMVSEDGNHEYEVEPGTAVAKGYVLEKRSDAQQVMNDYQHITLWAESDEGLRNIWSLASVGYKEGFYQRPRIDWETLERYSEGVIATTGCMRGPLSRPLKMDGDEAKARENVTRLMEIYPDRLYVEIHTNQLSEQKMLNEAALLIAEDYSLPYFAAVDSHYAYADQKYPHKAWVSSSTGKTVTEDADLFEGDQDYHMATETEVREALGYLGQDVVEAAVAETVRIAARCNAEIVGEPDPPVFSKASAEHPDPEQRDAERLIDLCMENWDKKITPRIARGKYTLEDAVARFEREMTMIIEKRFPGYYLLVADYVNWARGRGCLVGPGRGSGPASIVAYLAGITDVDPIEYDLLFDRFINEGRTELPDFDVDFPTTWREPLKEYLRQRWGADYTMSIGTIGRLRVKGAVDALMRSLKDSGTPLPSWTEITALKAADDASAQAAAGTTVTWEMFNIEHEELMESLRSAYPDFMTLLEIFVGRVRSFGKHAAGMVVSTAAPLTDLPIRTGDDGAIISQFDMDALAALGHVKFDLLTLRTLDTLQEAIDRIRETHGVTVDVNAWDEEYEDPQVWEEIANAHTKGVFQVETSDGTRLTKRYGPRSVNDLADVTTLVRPGPSRSGLTDIFIRRRNREEEVTFPHPLLEETLGSTQGVPIFQEQVMAITMLLAGYSSSEADKVRKLLGKKQVEKVEAAGREFIRRSRENGVDETVAETIWSQLAEFAKYGFNKSHAVSYSIVSHWTAWFKVHYPAFFLCAVLSTVDSGRHGEFISEARRMGLDVGGPDINESGVDFTPSGTVIRYGLASVMTVGPGTAEHIVANQPYTSVEDFRERAMTKGSPVNLGHLKALSSVGAFDALFPNRRALDQMLEDESSGQSLRCVFKDESAVGPNGLPCTFDWANEVDPPMVSKGRGKDKVWTPKPPPKKCTVACRNYTKPEPIDPASLRPYTSQEILDKERELLGGWVSANPFERIDQEFLEKMHRASEVMDGPDGYEYTCAALVDSVRRKTDRNGNPYAFLTLDAQDGNLDAICFASIYGDYESFLTPGKLVFVVLHKNERGLKVADLVPAPDDVSEPATL